MKGGAVAANQLADHWHRTHPFALSRAFDLQDVGTHIRQRLRAKWAEHHLREIENANAFECQARVGRHVLLLPLIFGW